MGGGGDDPPYHAPVFVLTNHAHDAIEMAGDTTFIFVTDGFDAALRRARDVARDRDIRIAGSASTVRQALAAGAVDDIYIDLIPTGLGYGERIFTVPPDITFTQLEVSDSGSYTHIHYRTERTPASH